MLSNLKRNEICKCCLSGQERIQSERSKKIDRELSELKRRFLATQKIVLLGAGESGKSTFLKQMQIIHGTGFCEQEMVEYRTQIYENILKGMVGLVNGKTHLGLAWGDDENDTTSRMKSLVSEYRLIYKTLMDDRELDSQRLKQKIPIFPEQFLANNSVNLIFELWNDPSIRLAYSRRRDFPRYFVENVPYYIENLSRIANKNYVPNMNDILRSRRATTSINEIEMVIKNVPFRFVDVGGQRTQRQKWQQCFSDVTAILFLASCSEYDECLREDGTTSRLEESCKIFETLVNYKYLQDVEFILFLNKYDLLKDKIKISNIKLYCSDFYGNENSLTDVEDYLVRKFSNLKHEQNVCTEKGSHFSKKKRNINDFDSIEYEEYDNDKIRIAQKKDNRLKYKIEEKTIYSHFTTAIDTNNIKTIFEMVRLMIFEKNCKAIMLT